MHTRSQRCPQIGGTRCDITQMVVTGELSDLLEFNGSPAQSVENGLDVSSLLHCDNTQLVFLIHPHQECLLVVVENASSRGPVSVQVSVQKESVSLFE